MLCLIGEKLLGFDGLEGLDSDSSDSGFEDLGKYLLDFGGFDSDGDGLLRLYENDGLGGGKGMLLG